MTKQIHKIRLTALYLYNRYNKTELSRLLMVSVFRNRSKDKKIVRLKRDIARLKSTIDSQEQHNAFLQNNNTTHIESIRKLDSELTGAQLLVGKLSIDTFQSWNRPEFPKGASPFSNPTPWRSDYEEAQLNSVSISTYQNEVSGD